MLEGDTIHYRKLTSTPNIKSLPLCTSYEWT